ncbi:hypothetical protein [Desulfosporosinus sp. SB140]|uniref:hypothetical protein n=1 Tax=Desulfosporosinus paludis TaxID=3115649 RepID=UPI00388F1112
MRGFFAYVVEVRDIPNILKEVSVLNPPGKDLFDPIEQNDKGTHAYIFDCHNIPICRSYGETSPSCVAGGHANTRCSLAEKMQIRILNDANPNAAYKPKKVSRG